MYQTCSEDFIHPSRILHNHPTILILSKTSRMNVIIRSRTNWSQKFRLIAKWKHIDRTCLPQKNHWSQKQHHEKSFLTKLQMLWSQTFWLRNHLIAEFLRSDRWINFANDLCDFWYTYIILMLQLWRQFWAIIFVWALFQRGARRESLREFRKESYSKPESNWRGR